MIALTEIGSYVPAGRVSNFERQSDLNLDEAFIRNKLGVHAVSRMAADEDASDLGVQAFKRLRSADELRLGLDCLAVCTQNPDGHGIPHTSAVVHGKLALPEACAAFDLGLGCSGYVYGLAVVGSFLQTHGLSRGVLLTADPYSKIVDPNDRNTAPLFGDGGTATVLRADAPSGEGWEASAFVFSTRGAEGAALHNNAGPLQMNGRAIFNFAATAVPQQVHACLEKAELAAEQVDLFVFHQGSKYILDTLQRRLKLNPDKVAVSLAEHGNTVSSSIPLTLEPHLANPNVRTVLLSGFGVGLSWASCVLRRRGTSRS
jgi:3-oxoacyl-[acyl-carrier-protein] synthase III